MKKIKESKPKKNEYKEKKVKVTTKANEWIKKELGAVENGYKLVSIEFSGEAMMIIEHWQLI